MQCCKLCGFTQFDTLFDTGFEVLLCRNCGLVFVGDKDRDFRQYYSEAYDYRIENGGHFLEDERRDKRTLKWCMRHLPAKADLTLLEIGCGAAYLLKRLKDRGITSFGIEPGRKAAAFAKRLIGDNYVNCSMLEDIQDSQSKYDVILLVQTFEHFPDPLNSLRRISSLLKDDGFLFIEVPNYYAPYGFFRSRSSHRPIPSPNHLFVYTRKTLGAFLKVAGFDVKRTSYSWSNIRVVAKMGHDNEPIAFENVDRVRRYSRLLAGFHTVVAWCGSFSGGIPS